MKALWRGIKLWSHFLWEGHFQVAFTPKKYGWRRICGVCDWGIKTDD